MIPGLRSLRSLTRGFYLPPLRGSLLGASTRGGAVTEPLAAASGIKMLAKQTGFDSVGRLAIDPSIDKLNFENVGICALQDCLMQKMCTLLCSTHGKTRRSDRILAGWSEGKD